MNDVYLSIGTNIGERYENLQHAIQLLMDTDGIEVVRISSVYETAAVGFTDQADFLNIAVYIKTIHSSSGVLAICQSIENELGRVREEEFAKFVGVLESLTLTFYSTITKILKQRA